MGTHWTDRLLTEALRTAGDVFAGQSALGELIWTAADGSRCYRLTDTLTIMRGGEVVLEYRVAGVDLADVV